MSVVDQKRIAKNTLLLYIRMGVIMLICFYTSRVILDTLGEVDFGLYNVIGGIVVAFSFLNGVMAAACNRYFAIEIGRNDYDALKKIFSLNITIFLALAGIILILAETVGLWFLNAKMVIPADRITAANWVYQFSILAFLVNMMSTPYRAIIIAKEKMKVFAYCSVVEALLKLSIAFLIIFSSFDKLIFYAILMFLTSLIISLFYFIYCTSYYKECYYSYFWNKMLFKEIVGYTGWNIIGSTAAVGRSQGVNIILNMFFGPTINAARGIAYQVYTAINQFVQNFATAFNPQIIKSYAANEKQAMLKLVFQSSKFSYYLLFLLILPIYLEAPIILNIWLVHVPDHATAFTRIILITALIDSLSFSLISAVQATGKVKYYQIAVGGTLLLALPIAYFLLKFSSFSSEDILYVILISSIIAQILRIIFMNKLLNMKILEYIKHVILPIIIVSMCSCIVPVLFSHYAPSSILRASITICICFLFTILSIFTTGLTKSERAHIISILKTKFKI